MHEYGLETHTVAYIQTRNACMRIGVPKSTKEPFTNGGCICARV